MKTLTINIEKMNTKDKLIVKKIVKTLNEDHNLLGTGKKTRVDFEPLMNYLIKEIGSIQ